MYFLTKKYDNYDLCGIFNTSAYFFVKYFFIIFYARPFPHLPQVYKAHHQENTNSKSITLRAKCPPLLLLKVMNILPRISIFQTRIIQTSFIRIALCFVRFWQAIRVQLINIINQAAPSALKFFSVKIAINCSMSFN